MAIPPVRILPDLIVDGQIIKRDENQETILVVSGNVASGYVSSSVPIYAPNLSGSTVNTTGNITRSGTIANPVALKNFISLITVTASSGFSGDLFGTASHATTASYALTAAYAENVGDSVSPTVANVNYKKLRYKITGTFGEDGYAEQALPLTQYGSASFSVADIDYFTINIMVRESGAANWTNDLIAYELFISASQVFVGIHAPDISDSGSYKLLAINENPTAYDVS